MKIRILRAILSVLIVAIIVLGCQVGSRLWEWIRTEHVVESYPNGRIMARYSLRRESGHWRRNYVGSYEMWYSSGQLMKKMRYSVAGRPMGTQRMWHRDGTLWSSGCYDSRGEETGLWTWWNQAGDLCEQRVFEAGEIVSVRRSPPWIGGDAGLKRLER